MRLRDLAKRHCGAARPQLSRNGLLRSLYDVSQQYFDSVASGQKKASARLLNNIAQAHVRLFPDEPVTLDLPNHPPVLLGQPSNH